ncbi:MAG: ABC transporter substrate-binding protein [Gallionella sp.]
MKFFLKIVLLMVCMGSVAQAEVGAPDALIRDTAQEVISVIKHDPDIKAGDKQKLLALVDAKILPIFDFKRMTQLAVGKYWRRASLKQKKALELEFRDMLVRTYTKAFSLYRDQTIKVLPLKMTAEETDVTVKTRINKKSGQFTTVNYHLKKRANGWKVYDLTIEGVSLVTSYRGSFGQRIDQSGIDALIKALSDMNLKASKVATQRETAK